MASSGLRPSVLVVVELGLVGNEEVRPVAQSRCDRAGCGLSSSASRVAYDPHNKYINL